MAFRSGNSQEGKGGGVKGWQRKCSDSHLGAGIPGRYEEFPILRDLILKFCDGKILENFILLHTSTLHLLHASPFIPSPLTPRPSFTLYPLHPLHPSPLPPSIHPPSPFYFLIGCRALLDECRSKLRSHGINDGMARKKQTYGYVSTTPEIFFSKKINQIS